MKTTRLLVVDDEADLRELLIIMISKMGLAVDSAECLQKAKDYLEQQSYALILTDMRLPDGSGIDLVNWLNEQQKNIPIAVLTAYSSAENAVAALKVGAFDYLSKPIAIEQLRTLIKSALGLNNPSNASTTDQDSLLIGESTAMQTLRNQIARLAKNMAPVAIHGESGTGKELVAREIHRLSSRANKAFIAVNCGAIPENLMEAEFFGYRKGAFTGANEDRDGFFQAANGGTLLLDEVAELPLAMQVKLLRAIQQKQVRKVGATQEQAVDVRIISATHQDLAKLVNTGLFRQDLYYRLNVIELNIPSLRERPGDIPLLCAAILSKMWEANNLHTPTNTQKITKLSDTALSVLSHYHFPGNVRELENILERALAFAETEIISDTDLSLKPLLELPQLNMYWDDFIVQKLPLPLYLGHLKKCLIEKALQNEAENLHAAAKSLGLEDDQLQEQINELQQTIANAK